MNVFSKLLLHSAFYVLYVLLALCFDRCNFCMEVTSRGENICTARLQVCCPSMAVLTSIYFNASLVSCSIFEQKQLTITAGCLGT